MRKLTFVLTLIALLVIGTAVVYAGVSYGGDPTVDLGNGYWAHLMSGTDEGTRVVSEELWGAVDDDEVWAEGCVTFQGAGEVGVKVWITRGKVGPILESETETGSIHNNGNGSRLCAEVEVDRN